MVEERAGQEFMLTNIICVEHYIILVYKALHSPGSIRRPLRSGRRTRNIMSENQSVSADTQSISTPRTKNR